MYRGTFGYRDSPTLVPCDDICIFWRQLPQKRFFADQLVHVGMPAHFERLRRVQVANSAAAQWPKKSLPQRVSFWFRILADFSARSNRKYQSFGFVAVFFYSCYVFQNHIPVKRIRWGQLQKSGFETTRDTVLLWIKKKKGTTSARQSMTFRELKHSIRKRS